MWAVGLISALVASAAWSQDPGPNLSASVTSNTTATNQPNIAVSRNKTVNVGSDVNLQCTNKTWSEMMHTIWNVYLHGRHCRIASTNDGQSENSCSSKALHNSTRGESYLRISNFSKEDEGFYKCEAVYSGGSDSIYFYLSATVPPRFSAWLEWEGGRLVAVCLAEGGRPAATVTWRNSWNFTSKPAQRTQEHQDGSYTVTSRLVVPEAVARGNLTCVVDHPYWKVEQTKIVEIPRAVPWVALLISGLVVTALVAFLAVLFFTRKTLILLRPCWQSSTPSESKSPPSEEVEEVEPYASYVQRENSIYNSSADLFT